MPPIIRRHIPVATPLEIAYLSNCFLYPYNANNIKRQPMRNQKISSAVLLRSYTKNYYF